MGQIGYLFNLIFTFPIFNALMLLYHLFGDFGLSIIVLTLIIKLVLFPLTLQQLKSMKATQALQPQLAEIRRKYGKDQQAQALAMQALYKEYGINPAAGCLPLLIQLPVLYGLFYALSDVVRSTGTATQKLHNLNSILYPFVPHFTSFPTIELNWFTFINASWHISLANPDPTHILPVLAGLATFVQLRMSQPKAGATTANANDPTAQSMKTMQYIMPLITVFFGWTFPAGLALYWTVSSVFQAVQQYFVTGWGGLLTTPDFLKTGGKSKNGSASSNGTTRSSKGDQSRSEQATTTQESDGNESSDSNDSASTQLRPVPRTSSPASARRRQGGGSASARRRSSNNIQKKNVTSH